MYDYETKRIENSHLAATHADLVGDERIRI